MLSNFFSSENIYFNFSFNFLFSSFKLQISIYTVSNNTLIDNLNSFLLSETLLSICMTIFNNVNLVY